MDTETRSTKRKRSTSDAAIMCSQKKASMAVTPESASVDSWTQATTSTCALIQAVQQYGLLELIISCLSPSDLLSLALSCKATYNAMFPRPRSLENLLSKVSCSGQGIKMRQRMHKKSSLFYAWECTEFAQCSTVSKHRNIESHPCVSCKLTTCDECRIHCVYQSIYEEPVEPEDLPNFSGFVLLEPLEVAILSPHHMPGESDGLAKWNNPATCTTAGPYHDQGFLDMPLESRESAAPEKITDVLDLDLGMNCLREWCSPSIRSTNYQNPVLADFCNVVENRKLHLCAHCKSDAQKGYQAIKPALPNLRWLDDNTKSGAKGLKECHCTLRSRILDRWQCVKCYDSEKQIMKQRMAPSLRNWLCNCGGFVSSTVCMWCWGHITAGQDRYVRVYENYPELKLDGFFD